MLESGKRLGPYEIVTPLGAGGMGEVYRAHDRRLERDVAVKVLSPKLVTEPDALERFKKEAKAVAALSHPNVLAIHEFDHDGDVYFAVTELLEGDNLRGRIQEGPIPWRKAVEICIAVADGLAAAHSKGIIHRDLKPENIFITKDGQVKILDFGLAEILEKKSIDLSSVSRVETEQVVVGTVCYMAPEQIRAKPPDARSDIFSFGCLLYEMVCGARPFGGETVYEMVSAILKEDPPDLDSMDRQIPFELQNLILHCLEKNPNERAQSAHDLSFELKTMLNISRKSQPVPVPKEKQTRWLLAAGIIVSLFLLSGAIYLGIRKAEIRSIAVLPFQTQGSDPDTEYISDGITENVITELGQLPQFRVMARSTVFRYKEQPPDSMRVGKELNVDTVFTGVLYRESDRIIIRAELVRTSDGSHLWGANYTKKMTEILSLQQEIADEIIKALNLNISSDERRKLNRSYTQNTEAFHLYLKGRYYWNKRTSDSIKKGIEYFQKAIDQDPTYALPYAGLADCYALLGGYDFLPPEEAFPRARAAAERALQIDEELGEAHTSLAQVSMYYWDWNKAEREFKRALELQPGYATAHQWYANYLSVIGKQDAAVESVRKALELDPLSLTINEVLAWHLYRGGHYKEALEQVKRTLEFNPDFVPALAVLGSINIQTGKHSEAVHAFEKAISLSGDSNDYKASLALAYAFGGNQEQAKTILSELTNSGKYLSPVYIAMVYTALKDYNRAFDSLEEAYKEHAEYLIFIKLEPNLIPLHSDARFQQLLKRIGLPAN